MTDLDGSNRKMILSDATVRHIYSLVIFENWMFWSDWERKQIHRAHKFNGSNQQALVTLVHRPMGQ